MVSVVFGFRRMIENRTFFHLRPFPAKTNGSIFQKIPKTLLWGHFWTKNWQNSQNSNFSEKSGCVISEPLWFLNFIQNIRKQLISQFPENCSCTHRWTHRQTHRQPLIYRTLPCRQGTNKSLQNKTYYNVF